MFRVLVTPANKSKRTVEVPQSSTGADLAAKVVEVLGLPAGTSLKLICGGRVVSESGPLLDQGVRPGVAVMVVKMDKNDDRLKVEKKGSLRFSIEDRYSFLVFQRERQKLFGR